jgi:branched-chain amino acid transport system ATP-binding protein
MAELIGRLGERLAVLLIEHRMSIVQRVSQQVSVLSFGALLAQGPPEAIASDPRVQDAYLGRAAGTGRAAPPRRSTLRSRAAAVPAEDLVLRDVHTYYGSSHVLHGVSLTARQGQVSAILGRNGAGKTTTLATIMNLVQARSGSIRLGQRELVGTSTHAVAGSGIALVPENRWVFPDLTVEENLRVAAGSRVPRRGAPGGRPPGLARREAPGGRPPGPALQEAYAEFPVLAERRQAKGRELSGGQQQMLALGRALVRCARVILLDEPTQGLSPAYVEVVVDFIRRLREQDVTVVLVEQSIDVVAAVADTVYLMRDGEIAAELAAAELDRESALVQESLLLEPVPPRSEPAADRRRQAEKGAAREWPMTRSPIR